MIRWSIIHKSWIDEAFAFDQQVTGLKQYWKLTLIGFLKNVTDWSSKFYVTKLLTLTQETFEAVNSFRSQNIF